MQSYDAAVKAHKDFQTARDQVLKDLDAQIAELNARKREVLAWGKPVEGKKRGRPKKDLTTSSGVLK